MSGKLTAEQVREVAESNSCQYESPVDDGVWITEYDWQATADELNAMLESDEPPCDELLRCLENDWHISASWDGLRKFWCIELTEDGVRMRDAAHGTLTAEQVRKAIERHSAWVIGNNRCFHDGAYEAIADELNAALGNGECTPHGEWESVSQSQEVRHVFCDCGYELGMDERDSWPFKSTRLFAMPNYCQECGRKILKAVKR